MARLNAREEMLERIDDVEGRLAMTERALLDLCEAGLPDDLGMPEEDARMYRESLGKALSGVRAAAAQFDMCCDILSEDGCGDGQVREKR